VVRRILSSSEEEITEVYTALRKKPIAKFGKHSYLPALLLRLAQQYSKSDPSNLVPLVTMNYMVLQKGDVIYIPTDSIHAYLSGDIVECMTRSDNVLNTGFYPERSGLCRASQSEDAILTPKKSDKGLKGRTKVLAPPMSELNMLVTELEGGQRDH
jgi:mannose-6-phosphate isomerase